MRHNPVTASTGRRNCKRKTAPIRTTMQNTPPTGKSLQNNTANFDFHCHSTVSDGVLSPADVVRRAVDNGVTSLSLTDHDDTSGCAEAARVAKELGIKFINGVEISAQWQGHSVHIVGLGVELQNAKLQTGLASVREGRRLRARRMADELERLGIGDVLEGALELSDRPALISRTHFARYLLHMGYAKSIQGVFQNYLSPGKPGYVKHNWAQMTEALDWIKSAGGIAVLAHPGRYPFSNAKLKLLLGDFADLGGRAIEVQSASHSPDKANYFRQVALRHGFFASRGSDFHAPRESHADLGELPQLSEDLIPVWHLLQ